MSKTKSESYTSEADNPQEPFELFTPNNIPEPRKKSIVFDRIVDIAIIVIAVAMVLELILWR